MLRGFIWIEGHIQGCGRGGGKMGRCKHNGEVSIFGIRPASFPNFPFHLMDKIGGFVILDELWLRRWCEIIKHPMKIPTLYVPIEDYGIPTVEDMDLIVDFVK